MDTLTSSVSRLFWVRRPPRAELETILLMGLIEYSMKLHCLDACSRSGEKFTPSTKEEP
jgi:hypothetical protein